MTNYSKLILERRGLILGEETEYYTEMLKEMRSIANVHFHFVDSYETLVTALYEYEPMLIVMELDPKNIGIATRASKLHKYRQSISVGIAAGENDGFRRLVEEGIVTDTATKSGIPRKDSFTILRSYKHYMKYGVNLKTMMKRMPIVTEICWHDVSWDEKFLRSAISEKLDRLGVKRELQGHKFLIAAIALQSSAYEAPELNKIYAYVAEYYGTTPSAVEKDIRYAIENAWIVGDIDYQHTVFGMTIDEERGKPTNAEFIARLAMENYFKEDKRK